MGAVVVTLLFLYVAPWLLAASYLKRGEAKKALHIYRLTAPVYSWTGNGNVAILAYNIGLCLSYLGERKEAEKHLHTAMDLMQNFKSQKMLRCKIIAMALSALYYAEDGALEQADNLATSARAILNPKSPFACVVRLFLAVELLYTERFDEAEAELKAILEDYPKLSADVQASVYSNLGTCAYCQGNFGEALKHQVLAEEHSGAASSNRAFYIASQIIDATDLGDLVTAQKAEAKLIPMIQKLEEAQRNQPYWALATLALARGDLDRTLDYAERSYNESSSLRMQANSLYLQACVYAKRENPTRALQLLKEAETYPNFTLFKDRIVKLRQEVEAKYHS